MALINEIQTALSENGIAVINGVRTKQQCDVARALVRKACYNRNLDVTTFQAGDKFIIERVDRL